MLLKLLRLINHPILRLLAQSETEKAILQDRVEHGDQECRRLRDQNDTLVKELTTYFRMDKNLTWQTKGAPAPFPDSPHLPTDMVHQPDSSPQPAERSQGSQLVASATARFKEQTRLKIKPITAK